ncbi:DUF6174 domain-containing protein [Alteromonas sp. 1_MG-2023]|uniref:DUF6174 domain-containing protein n=1 Tax=Alteromonas sp. 1_MG-2023 TaxID=3062669 RepID=UPI0026E217ED|nr:DUF6174 domain-containing protein [Alteromonas sp. 1_MG-2023]MDO6568984.1 DUF6174 domain-containing protein [Alteromonas sp. 1_MG-2023]
MKLKLITLLSLFCLYSCGGSDTPSIDSEEIKSVILENQAKWLSAGITDYSFTYSRAPGDCPLADALPIVDINVEDNVAVSVYFSGTSEIADIVFATTIDELFSYLLQQVDEEPIKFSNDKNSHAMPDFDIDYGFPVDVYIDRSKDTCDASYISIFDFK